MNEEMCVTGCDSEQCKAEPNVVDTVIEECCDYSGEFHDADDYYAEEASCDVKKDAVDAKAKPLDPVNNPEDYKKRLMASMEKTFQKKIRKQYEHKLQIEVKKEFEEKHKDEIDAYRKLESENPRGLERYSNAEKEFSKKYLEDADIDELKNRYKELEAIQSKILENCTTKEYIMNTPTGQCNALINEYQSCEKLKLILVDRIKTNLLKSDLRLSADSFGNTTCTIIEDASRRY